MKLKYLFAIIAMSSVIISCSDGDDESDNYIYYSTEQMATEALNKVEVSCKDRDNCTESIGGLAVVSIEHDFFSSSFGLGVCSQTLIAKNKILTNRHCLTDNMMRVGASCSNMTAIFPKTATQPKVKVKCKSVESLSNFELYENYGRPDWAILTLEKNVDRKVISINTNGIPNGKKIDIYPVYYSTKFVSLSSGDSIEVFEGEVKNVKCESNMANYLATLYSNKHAPLFGLTCDQDLIKGNSGSGIFNGNGEIIGLISYGVKKGYSTDFMGQTVFPNNKIIAGTNLHCIEELNNNRSESSCYYSSESNYLDRSLYLSILKGSYIPSSVEKDYNASLSKNSFTEWEAYSDNYVLSFNSQPDYLGSAQSLTDPEVSNSFGLDIGYKLPNKPKCFLESQKSVGTFNFDIPILTPDLTNLTLTNYFTFDLPLANRSLSYSSTYNSSKNNFEVSLNRLEGHAVNEYLRLIKSGNESILKCLKDNTFYYCSSIEMDIKRAHSYTIETMHDPSLFTNELFMDTNINNNLVEFTVPVCD